MAKKENAIYAPGELGRVREKLGVTDFAEAKRMADLLGGEVGTERGLEPEQKGKKKSSDGFGRRRGRRVDLTGDEDDRFRMRNAEIYPGDDPATPVRLRYSERVKMDQYAGQIMFEIKTALQVLTSIFSIFKEPVDYLSPRFVTSRMNEYFSKIEKIVNAARNLFPKNNIKRNNQLKRASPFVYKILEVLRNWDIEQLAKDISELQAHPRTAKATDFAEVLREIYKPLFILEDLDTESFKTAFKLIYKILYIESPMDAKEKYQGIMRNLVVSLTDIRRNVHFGLYPLLMKIISDRFIPYDRFFVERRRRFMAFLNVTETVQLNSADLVPQQLDKIDVETLQQNLKDEETTEGGGKESPAGENSQEEQEEDLNDPKVIERKIREEAEKTEAKALEQGRSSLESLFPKANWDKLDKFPDLYPYFANSYSMRGGYELIAPTDPVQQVSVLMHILDDFFIGFRYMNFATGSSPDGSPLRISEELTETFNNWRSYIEDSFSKDYLPRLSEYCRMIENSEEARLSTYAKKTMNELHWIKRLYFLPYYKFESIGPPPFPKAEIIPIYSLVRKVRKNLTSVAMGIEQGLHQGGAAAKAACNGINNPWEAYHFPIPNPVSKRLDVLLTPDKRINATLIFFALYTVTLLDHIINNENSWAYEDRPGPLFRSIRNEGRTPLFGVDEKLDADKIFRDAQKKKANS